MLSSGPARLRLIPRLIVLAAALYGLCWVAGFPRTYDDEELPPSAQRSKDSSPSSPHYVEPNQLVVSIKTTAPDVHAKLPPLLLLTNSIYHDSLLLMGDLHMDIGPFHVHDVLDRVDVDVVTNNPDLERYRRQLAFAQHSIDLGRLKDENPDKEKEAMDRLDKFKMLRMLEKAWELKSHRSWYVFADTETYLIRPSLMEWLGQFDSSQPVFFGNTPDAAFSHPFAMGGSTFILSGGAMHALFVEREHVVASWDSRVSDHKSSFDVLFSFLSTELNLKSTSTWPYISGFHPSTVPYGPGLWCEAVLAMHSVPSDLASDIWRLQRDREEFQHVRDPLLFADLWRRFLQPEDLSAPRDNWDNLSSGPENAHWNILFDRAKVDPQRHHQRDEEGRAANGEDSWEACRDSCANNDHCVQWSYSSTPTSNYNENGETKCHVSRSMKFGADVGVQTKVVDGETVTTTWKSGWRKDKFEDWANQQRCKNQQN